MSFFHELAHQYIDGEWLTGSGSWDIIDVNPYNGEKLCAVTVATVAEVDRAYRAAERAQTAWAATRPHERQAVLVRALAVVEARADEIAEAMVDELGGTLPRARYEIDLGRELLREAIRQTVRPVGGLLPAAVDGKENRLYRRPVGVVSVINAFNFPFVVAMKSVAPALALGNAVVMKPHQNAPVVGGGLVARVFEEAGLPPGLLNVVVTDSAEIGDAFIEHPVPAVISFTGSDRVGRRIAALAARHFKRCVLELSGNSALVVLDDADIDAAVDAAVFSRFFFQGQVGMAANRILVDRLVEREFTERFVAEVSRITAGDPHDPATRIGPVINAFQADALSGLVTEALDAGATALLRGRTRGNVVEPTVLTGVPEGSPADAGGLRAGGRADPLRRGGRGREDRRRHPVRAERGRAHRGRGARGQVRAARPQRDVPRQRAHRAGRSAGRLRGREDVRTRPAERRRGGGRLHDHALDLGPVRPHGLSFLNATACPGLADRSCPQGLVA